LILIIFWCLDKFNLHFPSEHLELRWCDSLFIQLFYEVCHRVINFWVLDVFFLFSWTHLTKFIQIMVKSVVLLLFNLVIFYFLYFLRVCCEIAMSYEHFFILLLFAILLVYFIANFIKTWVFFNSSFVIYHICLTIIRLMQ
jgi:hypothetical protein